MTYFSFLLNCLNSFNNSFITSPIYKTRQNKLCLVYFIIYLDYSSIFLFLNNFVPAIPSNDTKAVIPAKLIDVSSPVFTLLLVVFTGVLLGVVEGVTIGAVVIPSVFSLLKIHLSLYLIVYSIHLMQS